MRKSFDGLSAMARHAMNMNPLSGALFVFINRRANQMKVLYWDRTGFCVWAKRLERGRFISNWAGDKPATSGLGMAIVSIGTSPSVKNDCVSSSAALSVRDILRLCAATGREGGSGGVLTGGNSPSMSSN
ncbi:IS66 family insertion sequence element accessory protein TnpB [Orrella sp. 11846]|uniref:IS66 family insertion sequence element accessory protein TnpB n=1 Tax=Orrella sp. 11846 TaxID=3409913 RepID=UPI003B5AE480